MAKDRDSGTLTGNASSTGFQWSGRRVGHFAAYGTFGSGTITLEYSLDDGTTYKAVDSTNLAFTEDGNGNFELPRCLLRATVSGATSPDIDYFIESVPAIAVA